MLLGTWYHARWFKAVWPQPKIRLGGALLKGISDLPKSDEEYFREAIRVLASPGPENCHSCRQPNCDTCPHEPLAKVIGLLKTRDRLLARLMQLEDMVQR